MYAHASVCTCIPGLPLIYACVCMHAFLRAHVCVCVLCVCVCVCVCNHLATKLFMSCVLVGADVHTFLAVLIWVTQAVVVVSNWHEIMLKEYE